MCGKIKIIMGGIIYGEKSKAAFNVMTDGKREIIRQLLSEYDIKTAEDIQEALKDLRGGTINDAG